MADKTIKKRWATRLDRNVVAGCPIRIDYVRLPQGYRA